MLLIPVCIISNVQMNELARRMCIPYCLGAVMSNALQLTGDTKIELYRELGLCRWSWMERRNYIT